MMARPISPMDEARCRRGVMVTSFARPATAIVTVVARNRGYGIVRKHGYGKPPHANLLWETSMPLAKSSPFQRSRSQIEPARRTSQRAAQESSSNGERALVIPLAQRRAPARPAAMTVSAMATKAVSGMSRFAEHTLPNFLVAVFSWIITETLAGCTAYAEALYPIPPAPEAAEPVLDETPRRWTPERLSLAQVHARLDIVTCEQPTLAPALDPTDSDSYVRPERRPGAFWLYGSSLGIFITACALRVRRARARRQAIAELRGLDDRSLRDIGISACDIEYIAWRDMERE